MFFVNGIYHQLFSASFSHQRNSGIIIQPLQVIDLARVDQFTKWSTDPNKEFLRFAERWLSDGNADQNHYNNVSMNNYLLSYLQFFHTLLIFVGLLIV